MVKKKVAKKVSNKGMDNPKTTKKENEILTLLTEECLTPKQIALRLKTSKQNIYKFMKKLRKKGLLKRDYQKVAKFQSTIQPNHKIRLHGQEFNIRILYRDERYLDIRNRSNLVYVDGNTVRLYRDSVEVYSGKSFYADSVQKATVRSFDYWNRFFSLLENDLRVVLVKPRSQNIRLVNHHYAELNNELAEYCNERSEKIKVYTREDGKLWFLIDASFNGNEGETVHSVTAKEDMEGVVRPFFNDLRRFGSERGEPFLPGQVMDMLGLVVENQGVYAENIGKHLGVLEDMRVTLGAIRTAINPVFRRENVFDVVDYLFENGLSDWFNGLSDVQKGKVLGCKSGAELSLFKKEM